MSRKSIRTQAIIAEAKKAEGIKMPWARGARRAQMIERRSLSARACA